MIGTIAQAAVSLTQSIELSILAKATVVLACGLAAARLAGRAPASVRHLLLAVTFAAVAALPLAAVAAPGVVIEVPMPPASTFPEAPSVRLPFERSSAPVAVDGQSNRSQSAGAIAALWPSAVRAGWLAGAFTLCLSLAFAVARLARIRRDGLPRPELHDFVQSLARQAGIRRRVNVLEHERVTVPLTCGVWNPVILLPVDAREWNEADLRRVLVHELEHVRRGDWAIQLAARAACACYWFHPLAWAAMRQLCLEAERSCDDAVVRNAERTDYADQLLLLARRLSKAHAPAMLGMANRSDLASRVAALLDDRPRGRAGAFAVASAVLIAGILVAALAPVRAIAAGDQGRHVAYTLLADGDQRPRSAERREPRVRGLDRALYEAAESGDLAEVDQLIQAGANVNAAISGDGSALIAAARVNRRDIVTHLLDRGADPNLGVEGDGSPLIAAAKENAAAVVLLLLDRGARVDLIVAGDENALIQASGSGHLEIVKLLVSRGADVNARVWAASWRDGTQGEWRTPLNMAQRGRHAAVVEFLVSAGAR